MGDHYEYIAVYVDDLLNVSKDPGALINMLTKARKFKLKGTGKVSFHLGCDFFCDKDGHLCFAPRKYIKKMIANYERIFGTKPKQVYSPLPKTREITLNWMIQSCLTTRTQRSISPSLELSSGWYRLVVLMWSPP